MTESPIIANAERVARCEAVLARYNDEHDTAANLIDFLADARHWCDRHGQSFSNLDRVAHDHYLAELEKEGWL